MKNTVVKPSKIDGKGLFALRDFKIGEVVEPIEGEIVLRESESKYAVRLTGHRSLILTNKTKFVNSGGNNANVAFNLKREALIATRDIAAGDELISRYGSVFE